MRITERCACGKPLCLYEANGDWRVSCYDGCYDPGAEDDGPAAYLCGWGSTPEDALASYLTRREEADLEPVYVPSEIASFVVPRAPDGWVLSPDPTNPNRLIYGPMLAQKAANDT